MDFKDYYATLGVPRNAPVEDIKRAYRKLARQYHPDVSPLPDAEHKFKEINEAWEVLQNPEKKAQYDQMLKGGWHPGQEYASSRSQQSHFDEENDYSEFFNSIFGQMGGGGFSRQPRTRQGQDFNVRIQVPLSTAYHGGLQTIALQYPQRDAEGNVVPQAKSLNVKIPAGVTDGSQIRLKGQGAPGVHGGANGDLFIEVQVQPDPFFQLKQKDVYLTLPVTPWEAALGATLLVPTLGGNVHLKIPPNAQSGQSLRLKGRGMPNGTHHGDQYITLQIVNPQTKTPQDKEFFEKMAEQMPFNPREKMGI